MRRNRLKVSCAVLCLFGMGFTACAEKDNEPSDMVLAVSDNTADFGAYETFMLAEPPEDAEDPPADLPAGDIATINNAIVKELQAQGLTQVTEDPDLLVASFVKIKTVDAEVTGYWYEYYWGWYWEYWETWYHEEIVEFDMGTLVVDAVDTRDKADETDDRLVFRGAAMGVVNDDASSDRTERIKTAVKNIFKEWPEGSAK